MKLLQIVQLVNLTKQCTLVFLFSEISLQYNSLPVPISRQLYFEVFHLAIIHKKPQYLLKNDKNIPTFQRYYGKYTINCHALIYDGSRGHIFNVTYPHTKIDIANAVTSKLLTLLALYIVGESYCHVTSGSCRKIVSNYAMLDAHKLRLLEYPII